MSKVKTMGVENNVESLKVNDYEEIRRQKMLENQKLLQELGLVNETMTVTTALLQDLPAPPNNFPATKRSAPKYTGSRANKRAAILVAGPGRISRRLRGEAPDNSIDLEEVLDQRDRLQQAAMHRKLERARDMEEEIVPANLNVPLTLASIGTTIWDLGKIYTGKNKSKYWSTHGCKFKHPYPVGYRATKSHFGNQYTMTISEGENGPIFSVQVNSTNTVFTGATPTAPWTTACLRSKSQGTRVSGPLFYGFSDLITMRLIEELENYEHAADQEDSTSPPSGRRVTRSRGNASE